MKKGFLLTLFSLFTCGILSAQGDTLLPLHSNPVLNSFPRTHGQANAKAAALTLPFFDDFAYRSPVADAGKWEANSAVFINPGYGRAPFTIGVATFDGLNRYGYPYNPLSTATGPADTLTSLPIDLSFAAPTDTDIYISFFYQPRGWGDAPETGDSLVLEFYKSAQGTWQNAWGKAGYDPGIYDSSWKYVHLRIADTAFFKPDFRFRFRNRAAQSGSADHWHIDYIFLDEGRDPADSIFNELAFGYQAPPLLKEYSSMPWWQVSANDLATSFSVFVRNNHYSVTAENYGVPFTIYDQNNTAYPVSPTGNQQNVPNYLIGGWDSIHDNYSISFTPAPLTDSGTYKAKLYITESANDEDFGNMNDTLIGYTRLHNYYAYDDGTAERGYGLNATGAMMAVKFTLNNPDTLKAMDIYFDPVKNVPSISNSSYEIWVWNDNGGEPGASIYSEGPLYPEFLTSATINTFDRDTLSTPLPLNAGTYYIGIKQTGALELNVGFDRNYNHMDKMFYNTSGVWLNSSNTGSYMIRPVMHKLDVASGVSANLKPASNLFIFPNPAKEHVTISNPSIKNGELVSAQIYDYSGRMLVNEQVYNNESIDISQLSNGIYILKISNGNTLMHTTKLFVAH